MNLPVKSAMLLAALILTACASHTEKEFADFRKFVDDRDACEHFGGEVPDPPNPERMKEVLEQMEIYCTGTDTRLAALKVKYAQNPKVMSKLNEYADKIEKDSR
jgi:hypothetical protein